MAFLRSSLLYKTRARRGSPGGCRKSKNLLKMAAYGKQLRLWPKRISVIARVCHCVGFGKAGNKGLALRLVMPYVQACKHAL